MSKPASSQKKTPQSKTSSTPDKKAEELEEELDEAKSLMSRALEIIQRNEKRLEKEDEFNDPVEHADSDDVRIYWKIRMIRGSDELMTSLEGSSVMSGLLDPKMKGHAPSQIQNEVLTKISLPISAKFMKIAEEVSQRRAEALETKEETPDTDSSEPGKALLGTVADAEGDEGEPSFSPVEQEPEPEGAKQGPIEEEPDLNE